MALWAALGGSPSAAQSVAGDTGTIEGRVHDDVGRRLAGVHVAVRAPSAGVDHQLATRGDGSFGALGLPAGVYSVEVWLEGYASAVTEDVDLDAGEALRLDFTLAAGRGTAITVTSSPRIDVSTPGRFTRVPVEILDELPDRLELADLARLTAAAAELPAVERGLDAASDAGAAIDLRGRPLAAGRVLVDGIGVEPEEAPPLRLDSTLLADRALEVSGGGLSPAFAGAPGGVIRLVTRRRAEDEASGWHGTLDLAARIEAASAAGSAGSGPGGQRVALDTADRWDASAAVGGSVLEERFALFAAGVRRRGDVLQHLAGSRRLGQSIAEEAAALRLSAAPVGRFRMAFSGRRSEVDARGLLSDAQSLAESAVPGSPAGERRSEQATAVADFGGGGRFHLHGWVGWFDGVRRDAVDPADRLIYLTPAPEPVLPAGLRGDAGFTTGLPGLGDSRDRSSTSARLQATWLAPGGHRIAVGAERAREELTLDRGLRGAQTEVLWGAGALGLRGDLGVRLDLAARLAGTIERRSEALFLEDQWRLARDWTLRLGVRAASDRVRSGGASVLDQPLEERVEPRLGVAWDVLGDGNYTIYLTADRYHVPLEDALAVAAGGDLSLAGAAAGFDDAPKLLAAASDPTPWLRVGGLGLARDLEAERWHELALGSEQLVVPGLRLRAEASLRELDRGVSPLFVDPEGDGTSRLTVVNPGEGAGARPYGAAAPAHPGAVYRRLALELSADVRLGRRWTAGGGYTYSRAEGNLDRGGTPLAAASSLATGNLWPDSVRLLAAPSCVRLEACFDADGASGTARDLRDRRHRWQLYGSWQLPGGWHAGAVAQYLSGAPWTPQIEAVSASGGGLERVGAIEVPAAGGERIGDALTQLDLELRWQLVGDRSEPAGRRLALYLVASNVLDEQRALDRWQALTLAPVVVPRAAFFEGFDPLALAAAQGVPADPRFGRPRHVQRPREVRFGLRFGF